MNGGTGGRMNGRLAGWMDGLTDRHKDTQVREWNPYKSKEAKLRTHREAKENPEPQAAVKRGRQWIYKHSESLDKRGFWRVLLSAEAVWLLGS